MTPSTSGTRASRRTSSPGILAHFAGLAVALYTLGTAAESRATYNVPASQAGVKVNAGDGQCSLYEAIGAINAGLTAPNSGQNGCVNDEWGGATIVVEGNGAHYKTFGAVINKWMEIYAYAPDNFAYLEHSGPSAVLTNTAGSESNRVYITGFTIQHTGTSPGRVLDNSGWLMLDSNTIKGGNVTANTGDASYGGGIKNSKDVIIFNTSVISNKARRGGGVYTTSREGIAFEKASITNNTATEMGGGIYTTGRVNADTVTVSDNTATGNGGGVYCAHGGNAYCSFYFSTIANNKAAKGGGIYRVADTSACSTSTTCNNTYTAACIFSANKTTGGAADDYFGDPHYQDNDAGGPGNKSLFSSFTGTVNHPYDFIGAAGLGSLLNNFGSITKSRAISSTSAAKNKSPAFCPEQDQNFNPRPSGTSCDLGAYELQQ
jgi:predicted outer membrane repeat protein